MSASQGCTDNMDVVQNFTEALAGRIGVDRYRMWFGQNVTFRFQPAQAATSESDSNDGNLDHDSESELRGGKLLVLVRGQFALDRLEKNFLSQLRGAAMQVLGSTGRIELRLDQPAVTQTELPLDDFETTTASTARVAEPRLLGKATTNRSAMAIQPTRISRRSTASNRHGKTHSISSLVSGTAGRSEQANHRRQQNTIGARPAPRRPLPGQLPLPGIDDANGKADAKQKPSDAMTLQTFVASPGNKLAFTAATMVTETPGVASPLFLCGPTGSGKTHLMCSIADMLRRRHRMRRVVHLSAEQFTNDFIASVSSSGITSFRSRYRDIDALLIDDIQFLASKKATLRELLYTIETLASAGRPMVFSGLHSPTEIQGLTSELAGRMAAGLVCQIGALDETARQVIMRRLIKQRCPITIGDDLLKPLSSMVAGDGRVISGLVNSVTLLARMHGRAPTMDEVRTLSGDLLRSARPVATLTVIEAAVCEAFQLPQETLRGKSQSRATTQPRMLAMYLARQMTSSAYAEIARHFGGKSHSTAIAAEKNVTHWLGDGKTIGRGHAAMSTREALDRVENLIRNRVG